MVLAVRNCRRKDGGDEIDWAAVSEDQLKAAAKAARKEQLAREAEVWLSEACAADIEQLLAAAPADSWARGGDDTPDAPEAAESSCFMTFCAPSTQQGPGFKDPPEIKTQSSTELLIRDLSPSADSVVVGMRGRHPSPPRVATPAADGGCSPLFSPGGTKRKPVMGGGFIVAHKQNDGNEAVTTAAAVVDFELRCRRGTGADACCLCAD